jgi:hypothetical protein
VLREDGRPRVTGARTVDGAPGMWFTGFHNPISGLLRELGIDARRIAKAVPAALSRFRRRDLVASAVSQVRTQEDRIGTEGVGESGCWWKPQASRSPRGAVGTRKHRVSAVSAKRCDGVAHQGASDPAPRSTESTATRLIQPWSPWSAWAACTFTSNCQSATSAGSSEVVQGRCPCTRGSGPVGATQNPTSTSPTKAARCCWSSCHGLDR